MAKRENQECTASVKTEEGSRGVALTAWKTAKELTKRGHTSVC